MSSDQRGTASVEAVILVPVIVIFAVLAIGFGRYEVVRTELISDPRSAAEAASVASSPIQASFEATLVGTDDAPPSAALCSKTQFTTTTDDFVPGGAVRVEVSCSLDMADLGVPGLAGTSTVRVSQVAPIDEYRIVVP